MAKLERDHAVTCGMSMASSRAPKPRRRLLRAAVVVRSPLAQPISGARRYEVAGRPLRRSPATTSKRRDV
jgi:hypothetical protein